MRSARAGADAVAAPAAIPGQADGGEGVDEVWIIAERQCFAETRHGGDRIGDEVFVANQRAVRMGIEEGMHAAGVFIDCGRTEVLHPAGVLQAEVGVERMAHGHHRARRVGALEDGAQMGALGDRIAEVELAVAVIAQDQRLTRNDGTMDSR